MMTNRGITVGALVGLMITAPLMAVLYLGSQAGGLPFAPFDVFSGLARVLPGQVITLGIDSMVSLISGLNLGETSSTAKTIEQILALGFFLLLGAVAGALFFAAQHRRARTGQPYLVAGIILGLVVAVPIILIFGAIDATATASDSLSVIWLGVVCLAWGVAIAWVHRHLTAGQGAEPVGAASSSEVVSVQKARLTVGPAIATQALSRRQFLIRVGNAAALITVVGAGLGGILESQQSTPGVIVPALERDSSLPPGLPNADATVMPAPGTRPEYTPLEDHYRIDISLAPPSIDGAGWVLPIEGLVNNPLTLTLNDLRNNYPAMDQYITLACISNPVGGDLIGTTLWTGASLQRILADADVQEGAAYLQITGADGFHETVSLDLVNSDERIMLCYAWDNQPLPQGHGYPLRIYIPDRYGMKQPKWITGIELVSQYEEGYWVQRGWDEVARMRTTSVVDTIASDAMIRSDGQLLVPVGGIAHAGARGISRVEVRVDDGDWQEALLRTPLSDTTWVIWRYDWPFEEGRHTFAVRAYDGNNIVQDDTVRGARPSGATGIDQRSATLQAPQEQG